MSSITSYQLQNLSSLKQALNVSVLKRVMNQDAQSVDNLMKAMDDAVDLSKGQSLDIKV